MTVDRCCVIGFIGFGEAAFEITQGLKSEGLKNIEVYDKFWDQEPYSKTINKRAQKAGVTLSNSAKSVIIKSDIVISATSSSVAIEVANESAQFLNKNKLFVDVNATAPNVMEKVASIVEKAKCKFVDVAMMGPVPMYQHKVPMLACGSGANAFKEKMSSYGMNVKVVSRQAGRASAIKMFRSIFMKGAAALLFETCIAANKYEVLNFVMSSISESMDKTAFQEMVNRLIGGTAVHADRRIHEMEDVIETLKEVNVKPSMSKSTYEVLKWVRNQNLKDYFAGEAPKDYQSVLEAIDKT